MFDFSNAFLISRICPFDSFSKCLIFKMRSFDFSNNAFDFQNSSKFVAFDFPNDTFDLQNLSRLISQMTCTFDFRNLSRFISQMTLLISKICRV